MFFRYPITHFNPFRINGPDGISFYSVDDHTTPLPPEDPKIPNEHPLPAPSPTPPKDVPRPRPSENPNPNLPERPSQPPEELPGKMPTPSPRIPL